MIEWHRMIVRPVPIRVPTAVVIVAPMTAPTPPTAPTRPNWKAVSPSLRKAYGASTTPTTALPTNHTCVAIASVRSPDRPYAQRTPSTTSATSPRAVTPVRGGGSSTSMRRKVKAE